MICPNCGSENHASYQFCQRCGTRLAQAPVNQPQQEAYTQPQQNAYYQPQQNAYAWPQQNAYAQPQQNAYAQPQQNAYAQPQQNAYAWSQQNGYAQPQQNAPKANKLKDALKKVDLKKLMPKNPKKLILPGIIAVAVIAVVIVLLCVLPGSGSGYEQRKVNYYTYFDENDDVSIFANGELIEEELDYDIVSREYSLDGKIMCYMTDEEEVYVARDGEIDLVAEDVNMFFLSDNGSTIICINNDAELTAYDTKSLDGTDIAEEVGLAVISPDGKTIVYTCEEDDGAEYIMYIYDGKESEELGDDLVAISVSNGGKYIYGFNLEKETVFAMNAKGESMKIGSGVDLDATFFVNKDHSQMLYKADDKWYVSVKGGEKIKLNSKAYSFLPVQPQIGASTVSSDSGVVNARVDNLSGRFYLGDDVLYFVNNKWECEKVASDVEAATVSLDGKTVYYLEDSGTLYTVTSNKLDEPVEVAEDVYSFRITMDGSAVYFVDEEETLFYCKPGKDAKKIADEIAYVYMTHDDICMFIVDYSKNSGDLYMSRNGGKKEHLFSDCYRVYLTSTVTYVATEYDSSNYLFTMYAATKGDKFDLMYEP